MEDNAWIWESRSDMSSPIAQSLDALAQAYPPDQARLEFQAIMDSLSVAELAALLYDWRHTWARPKQLLPVDDDWRSFGFLTGRAFGKTFAISNWIQGEVQAGRAMRIALMAQTESKTIEVMADGQSGLIATSPPWFKCKWEKGHLVWPNGAQAFIYSPEAPGAVHGPEHHLAWLSEVTRWPATYRDKAFHDLQFGLRLGYGRMVWDSTPIRRHPMVRYLLGRAKKKPKRHRVVRGSTFENRDNITEAQMEEWLDEYGGTQRGKEQLEGLFLDDSDGALWKQLWISRSRRDLPPKLKRRILSLDPAISDRKGTDSTGISDQGLGLDDQVFIIGDYSGKHTWEEWGPFSVRHYMRHHCDCIVVETDRGGDGIAANIRASAKELGIRVEVVKHNAPTRHNRSTIYVKEFRARISKGARAAPVATLSEKGRISHVLDGEGDWGELREPPERPNPCDLGSLEDTLTTWEPEMKGRSPDDLDAMVHGVWELANLHDGVVDHSSGFKGIEAVADELAKLTVRTPSKTRVSIRRALLKGGGSDKI
jgi:phage terminase large subunit-like protein